MSDADAAAQAERLILDHVEANPAGVPDSTLEASLSHLGVQVRAQAVNELLKKGLISITQQGQTLVYTAISQEQREKFSGMGPEDMLIYQIIEQSGNTGIWSRDLRFRSSLQQTQIAKILKTLESRRLIKCVKSIQSKNKKVYMLYDIEPSREVTGGAWYNEQEFDTEFIETLRQVCLSFVTHHGKAKLGAVTEHIKGSKISRVELSPQDILSILRTLEYDGLIAVDSKTSTPQSEDPVYKVLKRSETELNADTIIPCDVCPVFQSCNPTGQVSPSTCQYWSDYLDF
eukprot:TRINITY_DN4176_c0_g1_i4.p1 TRINITY_DN4176_c0_g1~~TRINITY_DN4176_c0_g1_i4.p1  ORF type:complete len:287 (+),score=29.92 TRINITY_DN4176_c0_g1_i4:104-964(+)